MAKNIKRRAQKPTVIQANLARVIYNAYESSDLLPLGDDDLTDFQTLLRTCDNHSEVRDSDGLFTFLVTEIESAAAIDKVNISNETALSALARVRADVDSIITALEGYDGQGEVWNKHFQDKAPGVVPAPAPYGGLNHAMRLAVIATLSDDEGVSEEAYGHLCNVLDKTGNADLKRHVKATDGRFYLPEGFVDDDKK